MNVPTANEIRSWSKVPFAELDYDESTDPDTVPDSLQVLVNRAVEYVGDVCGLKRDSGAGTIAAPDGLEETCKEAIQRRTEQLVYKAQEDEAETGSDFDLINNFSASSYSETRRGLKDLQEAKVVNPWPHLNDLLWRLMSEEQKDKWREWWGMVIPAFAVTEVDWAGTMLPPPGLPGGGSFPNPGDVI